MCSNHEAKAPPNVPNFTKGRIELQHKHSVKNACSKFNKRHCPLKFVLLSFFSDEKILKKMKNTRKLSRVMKMELLQPNLVSRLEMLQKSDNVNIFSWSLCFII